MSKQALTYLDGSVNVTGFKGLRAYCKFLISPYDDPSQRRNDIKWELAIPSAMQQRDWNTPWKDDHFPSETRVASIKLLGIYTIIGNDPQERRDGLHLDSAYKSGIQLFLTADKDNIGNHRNALEPLLGFRIFHPDTESQLIRDCIKQLVT